MVQRQLRAGVVYPVLACATAEGIFHCCLLTYGTGALVNLITVIHNDTDALVGSYAELNEWLGRVFWRLLCVEVCLLVGNHREHGGVVGACWWRESIVSVLSQ